MFELSAIIGAAVLGVIGMLYALFKVKSAQSDNWKAKAQAHKAESELAEKIITHGAKVNEIVRKVKQAQKIEDRLAQAKVDQGERDAFDKDTF